jgi:hypothetical protein
MVEYADHCRVIRRSEVVTDSSLFQGLHDRLLARIDLQGT